MRPPLLLGIPGDHNHRLNQGDALPTYTDFAYLALGVGTAFQVSDTNIQTSEVRRTVLVHSLVSFLFAAAILGITVNLVAGLGG